MRYFVIPGITEIIKVRGQKTFETHGSAKCVLKSEESRAVSLYVKHIRYKTTFCHNLNISYNADDNP